METNNIKINEVHLYKQDEFTNSDKFSDISEEQPFTYSSLRKKEAKKLNSENSIIGLFTYGTSNGNEVVKSIKKKNFLEKIKSGTSFLFSEKKDVRTNRTDDESLNSFDYSEIVHKYNSIDDIEYMQYAQTNNWFEKIDNQSRIRLLGNRLKGIVDRYRDTRLRNNSKARNVFGFSKSGGYLNNKHRRNSNENSQHTQTETSQNTASEIFIKDMELLTRAIKPQNYDDDLSSLSSVGRQDSIASENKTGDKGRCERILNSKKRNLANRRASF